MKRDSYPRSYRLGIIPIAEILCGVCCGLPALLVLVLPFMTFSTRSRSFQMHSGAGSLTIVFLCQCFRMGVISFSSENLMALACQSFQAVLTAERYSLPLGCRFWALVRNFTLVLYCEHFSREH